MTTPEPPAPRESPAPGLGSLLRPSTLAPVELDLRAVFRVGIALWTVALVIAAVLAATGRVDARSVATCVVGAVLGGVALGWEARRRRRG